MQEFDWLVERAYTEFIDPIDLINPTISEFV